MQLLRLTRATHGISANKLIVYFWFEGSLRNTHSIPKKSNADFKLILQFYCKMIN